MNMKNVKKPQLIKCGDPERTWTGSELKENGAKYVHYNVRYTELGKATVDRCEYVSIDQVVEVARWWTLTDGIFYLAELLNGTIIEFPSSCFIKF